MEIQKYGNNSRWYKYIIPKQLTKVESLYRWLFWIIRLDKEEYQELLHKKGQNTFIYCPKCDTEMISNNSFVKDTDFVYYKCKCCGTKSKWDFDAPCPILVDYDSKEEVENEN